jgi:hypothetical protein
MTIPCIEFEPCCEPDDVFTKAIISDDSKAIVLVTHPYLSPSKSTPIVPRLSSPSSPSIKFLTSSLTSLPFHSSITDHIESLLNTISLRCKCDVPSSPTPSSPAPALKTVLLLTDFSVIASSVSSLPSLPSHPSIKVVYSYQALESDNSNINGSRNSDVNNIPFNCVRIDVRRGNLGQIEERFVKYLERCTTIDEISETMNVNTNTCINSSSNLNSTKLVSTISLIFRTILHSYIPSFPSPSLPYDVLLNSSNPSTPPKPSSVNNNILITGAPSSGKSTLLRYITSFLSQSLSYPITPITTLTTSEATLGTSLKSVAGILSSNKCVVSIDDIEVVGYDDMLMAEIQRGLDCSTNILSYDNHCTSAGGSDKHSHNDNKIVVVTSCRKRRGYRWIIEL